MVMLDWEHENFLRLTRMNMWERDLRLVLWLLWMMPLLEPKEMERITGFSENRCYKVLRRAEQAQIGHSGGDGPQPGQEVPLLADAERRALSGGRDEVSDCVAGDGDRSRMVDSPASHGRGVLCAGTETDAA